MGGRGVGGWLAAMVAVAAIALAAGMRLGAAMAAGTAAPPATETAQARALAPPAAAGPQPGRAAAAAAKATATPTVARVENGGPLSPVRRYFADLAADDYVGAYQLLAPEWRAAHNLSAFVSRLPAAPPALGLASVASIADFDATVRIELSTGTSEALQLVDVRPRRGTARWLLRAPPAGAGG